MSCRSRLTSSHRAPPSSDFHNCPLCVGRPSKGTPSPVSISAYTRFVFRAIATPIFPTGGAGNPRPFSRCHVSPPSVERYSPLPCPPLVRFHVLSESCHMPANRRRGLLGSIAISEHPVF